MSTIKDFISSSIENESILRKFTILFLLMAILPVGVLYFVYLDLSTYGQFMLPLESFRTAFLFVITGVAVAYWAMRSEMKKLIEITKANQKVLENVLEPHKIHELSKEKNEIAILARTFSEITSRLEQNVKNLEIAKRTLHSVLEKVGDGISTMQNIDSFLNLIIETITEAFSAKVGILMLVDNERKNFYIKSYTGVELDCKDVTLSMDDGFVKNVIQEKKAILLTHLPDWGSDNRKAKQLFFAPMACAPLVLHDRVIGMVTVSGKKAADKFQKDELNLLSNLALQTAVAVENSELNHDAEQTYFETISALALAVDAKDRYSRGHLDRVANYVVKIATQLNLSEKDIKTLRDAARLHDVGKIGVPDEVLLKAGPLTPQEWEVMKRHPLIGESIIKPIRSLRNLCDIIRHHHEKLDGTGYPDGLRSEDIPLLVRITTIADIYDALTTDRPYRVRFSQEESFEQLRKMKGAIDQKIVEAFIASLKK